MSTKIAALCRLIQILIDEIIDELEKQPLVSLKEVKASCAAGAYLLYTRSVNGEYAVWAMGGVPLYSGKTIDMADRLGQHTLSIKQATNLNIDDFMVKYVELPKEYSHLACMFEAAMLKRYEPLWNTSLTGFGLKDVGVNRADSKISDWDTKHPGRPNRGQTPNRKTLEELTATIAQASRVLAGKSVQSMAEGATTRDGSEMHCDTAGEVPAGTELAQSLVPLGRPRLQARPTIRAGFDGMPALRRRTGQLRGRRILLA